ncbi:MAG: DinB family protein [Burkholderiales bacterium]|nr:DinB family protein [Phycisphaerae bacterium]
MATVRNYKPTRGGIMLDTLKQLLAHQYEASLCALNLAVVRCPEAIWDQHVAKWKFCQAAFHAVVFTDLYLQPGDDVEALKSQPFHVTHKGVFRDYEEFEDRPQVLLYEKPFVLTYLQNVRDKAQETITRESAEVLAGPSGFHWRKCSRAELHVYNIRHIQHHAAQLSLRLRLDAIVDIPWVGHAWKDA